MSQAKDLIERLKSEGRLDSRGDFTLDRRKAREKLQRYQHAEPLRYVLDLVQAAHAAGATEIRVDIDADDLHMTFDGEPLTTTDFALLYDALITPDPDLHPPARPLLASAINSASALEPRLIHVTSGAGSEGEGAYLRVTRADPDDFGVLPPDEAPRGTHIRLKHRVRFAALPRFFQNRSGTLPEERLLRERCAHASARVVLDGERISHGFELSPPAPHQLTAPDTPHPLHLCYDPASTSRATLRLIAHGVWLDSHPLPGLLPGLTLLASADHLARDLSRDAFVQDEAFDALLHDARLAELELLAQLLDAEPTRHDLDAPLLPPHLGQRLGEPEVRERLRGASERLSTLLDVALWRDVNGEPVPLRLVLEDAAPEDAQAETGGDGADLAELRQRAHIGVLCTGKHFRSTHTALPTPRRTRILAPDPDAPDVLSLFGRDRCTVIEERVGALLGELIPHAGAAWWSAPPELHAAYHDTARPLLRVPELHRDVFHDADDLLAFPGLILALPDTHTMPAPTELEAPAWRALAHLFDAPHARPEDALVLHVEPLQRALLRALLPRERVHDALPALALLDALDTPLEALDTGPDATLRELLSRDAHVFFIDDTEARSATLEERSRSGPWREIPGALAARFVLPTPRLRPLLQRAFPSQVIDAPRALAHFDALERFYAQPEASLEALEPASSARLEGDGVTGFLHLGSSASASDLTLYRHRRPLSRSTFKPAGLTLHVACDAAIPDLAVTGCANPGEVYPRVRAAAAEALLSLLERTPDAQALVTGLFAAFAPSGYLLNIYAHLHKQSPATRDDTYLAILACAQSEPHPLAVQKRLRHLLHTNALRADAVLKPPLSPHPLAFFWLDALFPRDALPLHLRVLHPHAVLHDVPVLKSSRGRLTVAELTEGLREHGSLTRWRDTAGLTFWPLPELEPVFDTFVAT